MKRLKKILVSVLSICMLLTLSCISTMAADSYTYKVTIYGGNKGMVNGQASYEITGIQAETAVDLKGVAPAQETDGKYYWKGYRQSGRDKNELIPKDSSVVKVTGDTDYVAAYGITSQRVAYTINYQDENGAQLAPSNTYYGDIGDKPVVAYQYIENYIPQAYAVTKTLVADEAQNVFAFTYTAGATDQVVTNTIVNTTTATTAGNTTTGTTAAAAPEAATAATPAEAATAEANANAQEAITNRNADNTVTSPDEETPQAVQDLDEETPKADIDASSGGVSPMVTAIIVGVAALLALIGLVFFLYKKKHKGVE